MSSLPIKSSIRLAASRVAEFLLRTRANRLPDFKRILVVSPHPDDETLGCGGTLAQAAARGAVIEVVVVTDGAASHPGHPILKPDELAQMRRTEVASALGILGLSTSPLHFLGVPDGTLNTLSEFERSRLSSQLEQAIASASPDVVLVPGRRDGSSEHESLALLLAAAMTHNRLSPRLFEYPVWARWHVRPLLREWFERTKVYTADLPLSARMLKERAIAAHLSQIRPMPPFSTAALPVDFVRLFRTSTEYFFEYSVRADTSGS